MLHVFKGRRKIRCAFHGVKGEKYHLRRDEFTNSTGWTLADLGGSSG
jgi:hypothetical protein